MYELKPSVIYALSGGPTWSAEDCQKLNVTDPFNRSPLTANELMLLRRKPAEIASGSSLMQSMEFLKDERDERLYNRFSTVAPMGLVSHCIESHS